MDTDEPNAAIAATTDFGLRRESRLAHPRQPKLYESGGVFLFFLTRDNTRVFLSSIDHSHCSPFLEADRLG